MTAPAPGDVVNGDRAPVTAALIATLAAATERPVGDNGVPLGEVAHRPDDTVPPEMPYYIVYPIPGGGYSGPPFADPYADVEWYYQVTSVGATRQQAEWARDQAHRAVCGRDPVGAYWHPMVIGDGEKVAVMERRPDFPGGTTPEAPTGRGIVSTAETYVIVTTPIGAT